MLKTGIFVNKENWIYYKEKGKEEMKRNEEIQVES